MHIGVIPKYEFLLTVRTAVISVGFDWADINKNKLEQTFEYATDYDTNGQG